MSEDTKKMADRAEHLLARKRAKSIAWRRFCSNAHHRPWALALTLLLMAALCWAMTWVSIPLPSGNSNPLLTDLWNTSVKLAVMVVAFLLMLAFFSIPPKGALQNEAELAHIGFTDRYKNPPALVSREQEKSTKSLRLFFYSGGISLERWIESQRDIQDALNITYAEPPQYAYRKRYYIMLTVVPGTGEPRNEALYDDEL